MERPHKDGKTTVCLCVYMEGESIGKWQSCSKHLVCVCAATTDQYQRVCVFTKQNTHSADAEHPAHNCVITTDSTETTFIFYYLKILQVILINNLIKTLKMLKYFVFCLFFTIKQNKLWSEYCVCTEILTHPVKKHSLYFIIYVNYAVLLLCLRLTR